jgi:hypothetical protein
MDGTIEIVPFATLNGDPVDDEESPEDVFYTYTKNANGSYNLVTVASGEGITLGSTTDATITPNKANFAGSYVGNTKTVFLLPSGLTYVAYTGISNVPKIENAKFVILLEDDIAKYVYLTDGSPVTSRQDAVYFIDQDTYVEYPAIPDVTDAYREYSAIVDGEVTTVKVKATAAGAVKTGLYEVVYDSNGLITNPAVGTIGTTDSGTAKAANGIVKLGSTVYTYNDNTVVYYISEQGSVTVGTAADIVADGNDKFTVVLSKVPGSDLVVELYIQVVANS